MNSVLIKNSKLYDGTGGRPFNADVLIEDGIIRTVGLNLNIDKCSIVDGTGKILAPGFINTHSHSELEIFKNPDLPAVIGQGITTEVLGQDGSSVTPIDNDHLEELSESMISLCGKIDQNYWWRSYKEYMDAVEEVNPSVRYVGLVGHGTIRMNVIGSEDRNLTAEELEKTCDLLERCMIEGAKGVSFGMIYPPSSYATTEELIEVCKTVAKYDGIVMVHTRNEAAQLIESFEEMVHIMKESRVRMHISHLKAIGYTNWGKVSIILDRLKKLNAEGYDISFDQYPWTASSTGMKVIVPGWAYAGGEDTFQERLKKPEIYAKILRETADELSVRGKGKAVQIAAVPLDDWLWMCGLRLDEVARRLGMDEPQAVLHILQQTRSSVTCVYHVISEEDVTNAMQSPYQTLCTDGIVGAVPHPRAYSSYARFLGRYVRDKKVMPLEKAIQNITSEPARRLRLWDRGLIREGMSADLVLINYDTVIDTNSYTEPKKLPSGILKVWVKGILRYDGEPELIL